MRGQTDKSTIYWYAVNNNRRATVWLFSVNNQALIQIWISSLIKFVLALNKHTYRRTHTHTHTRSRFFSIGQVPSCLRNLDWREKSVENIPLFPQNQGGREQLEPRKTGGGLERKEWQRKTTAAYTLIRGGKGEGEWKGSRISVQTIAICRLLSQGLPCRAVNDTCRRGGCRIGLKAGNKRNNRQRIQID